MLLLLVDMNRKLLFASFAALFCLSAVLIIVSTQRQMVGVHKGDSFTYYMGADYTSTSLNATVKVPEFEANNTDWVRIDITGTLGNVVNSTYTLQYKNGTEQYIDGQTDVSRNIWNFSQIQFKGVPIIPANLKTGDKASSLDLTINESVTRMCLGEERQLNHITWINELEQGDLYFDKETGMLVDMYRAHTFLNNDTGEAVTKGDIIKLTGTNAWSSGK
jgi:hypothetical protein